MEAIITQQGSVDGEIRKFRRENHFYRSFTGFTKDFKTPVEVRFYRSGGINGGGPISCCFWIRAGVKEVSGGSRCCNKGQPDIEGAFFYALESAGIKLIEPRGVDVWFIRNAIFAVSEAYGLGVVHIHEAHA